MNPAQPIRLRINPGLLLLAAVLVLLALLASLYVATQYTVTVVINGISFKHRTHQSTTSGILREMELALQEDDLLTAPSDDELRQGTPIRIEAARQVRLVHDGSVSQVATHATDVAGAVALLGVPVHSYDELTLAGTLCTLDTPLPQPDARAATTAARWLTEVRKPVALVLQRAVSFSVQEGGLHTLLYTTARTVGEALYGQGLVIYEGDYVFPSLSTAITPGLVVLIERSRPVTLDVGGQNKMLRTRIKTVSELLTAEHVELGAKDYVLPDPRTEVSRDMLISVVRVEDAYYLEEVPIGYEVQYQPDSEMEIDQSEVAVWGLEGARRRRIRVHYENGQEIYRAEEEEWIAREPVNRIINYGTKIVLRTLETSSGTVTYWRTLRMLATSYSAATAGTSLSSPYYGYTRLGERARKGIIAVDPRVINLRQPMYVPGYGTGYAGDTGSAITWRRIDLCFDDDSLEMWHRWVDVYLLTPVPDAADILWIVPNTPVEKG